MVVEKMSFVILVVLNPYQQSSDLQVEPPLTLSEAFNVYVPGPGSTQPESRQNKTLFPTAYKP